MDDIEPRPVGSAHEIEISVREANADCRNTAVDGDAQIGDLFAAMGVGARWRCPIPIARVIGYDEFMRFEMQRVSDNSVRDNARARDNHEGYGCTHSRNVVVTPCAENPTDPTPPAPFPLTFKRCMFARQLPNSQSATQLPIESNPPITDQSLPSAQHMDPSQLAICTKRVLMANQARYAQTTARISVMAQMTGASHRTSALRMRCCWTRNAYRLPIGLCGRALSYRV